MQKRLQASICTRQALSALIEGHLSTPDARAELVKLATRLIVEEALDAENRDALGRDYYEHKVKPGQGYHNGHRAGRLKTAEGFVEFAAPQIAGSEKSLRYGPVFQNGAHQQRRYKVIEIFSPKRRVKPRV